MKDYQVAGRPLFCGGVAFAPNYDAYGAEYAYFEPETDDMLASYLRYECKGVSMRVELNQSGERIYFGGKKREKMPNAYYYIDGAEVVLFCFRRIGKRDYVRSLNMKSGIFINGKKVALCASHVLRDGDRVCIGGAEVLYRTRPEPKAGTWYGF